MGTNTRSWHRTVASFIAGLSLAVVGAFAVQTLTAGATGENSGDSLFVSIPPCRLADTRPTPHIGPNTTFGSEAKTFQATGTNGQCYIPDAAVTVSLNVTAVRATMQTYLTIWPEGPRPTASSLNPTPGQVAFNAVTTPLSSTGSFLVYNELGSVDVIIDVNGYYVPAPPAALTVSNHAGNTFVSTNWGAPNVLVAATMTAPADGKVTVTAGAHLYKMGGEFQAGCSISATAQYDAEFGIYPTGSFSSARVFDVVAGETVTFSLVCWANTDYVGASNNFLSAIFTSAW